MSQVKESKLSIERIEKLAARRLAEILVMQMDYEKLKAQEQKEKVNEDKHGKSKFSNK